MASPSPAAIAGSNGANFRVSSTGRAGGEAGTEPLANLVQRGVFGDANTKIFIMTPATFARDLLEQRDDQQATPAQEQRQSQTNGNEPALYDTEPASTGGRLPALTAELGRLMPNVPVTGRFVYRRQQNGGLVRTGVSKAIQKSAQTPPE